MESDNSGPRLRCARMLGDIRTWKTIVSAFRTSEPVTLKQAWRAEPETDFRPCTVRTAWLDQSLLVYSVMDDDDIYNSVTAFNEPAFQHGDVFEIFLRPLPGDPYFEFHVSPRNQVLQLRIPSSTAFATPKKEPGIPKAWFLNDFRIETRVRLEPPRRRWSVMVTIPTARLTGGRPAVPGDEWLYSFSRYDYSRGRAQPVLSSSSPHQAVNFHRQQEWGRLLFV